jgi:hypothetical protein
VQGGQLEKFAFVPEVLSLPCRTTKSSQSTYLNSRWRVGDRPPVAAGIVDQEPNRFGRCSGISSYRSAGRRHCEDERTTQS